MDPHPTDRDILGCVDNRILQLILLPTEACNFRCTYCYENFKHSRMRPEVVEGVVNLLSRRAAELCALHLSWFGGEPLLAKDIVEKVLLHAHALRASNPGMTLFSDMTTNGWLLTRPIFERLLELGVTQYQISVDGWGPHHDEKRRLAGGRGTFERVWKNTRSMAQVPRDFTVIVRVHLAKDNLPSVQDFIRVFRDAFRGDKRFKLFFRPLGRMGGANDASLPVFELDEGLRVACTLSQAAGESGVPHITTNHITPICYAARGNSFVVRANGRLNKCTVALDSLANDVGRVLEDGRLELESQKMRVMMRGLQSRDPIELECPMHGGLKPAVASARAKSVASD